MQRGGDEAQLIPKFTEYEMSDLRAGGAPEEQLADYEAADPSFMAVPAALRYWRKHQADKISA
jgi:hypothetical protein